MSSKKAVRTQIQNIAKDLRRFSEVRTSRDQDTDNLSFVSHSIQYMSIKKIPFYFSCKLQILQLIPASAYTIADELKIKKKKTHFANKYRQSTRRK